MHKRTRANKHRHEKRRRTRRKQRGGELDEVKVKSISDWIDAVKKTPAFQKKEAKYQHLQREKPELRLGEYRMIDLKIPNLTLPEMNQVQVGQVESGFDINQFSSSKDSPFDIRTEGANLLEKWSPVMYPPSETAGVAELTPTPAEFKAYIEQNMTADPNNFDPDFLIAVEYLIKVENKLRSGSESNTIESLTDEAAYPLFVWALMMNTNAQPAPSLVSKEQVEEENHNHRLAEGRFGIPQQQQYQPAMQQVAAMAPTQEPASPAE